MALINCSGKNSCTVGAILAGAILGVLAAFFQITGVLSVTTAFLWVAFGIGVAYLGLLLIAPVTQRQLQRECTAAARDTLLAGILGTVLLAVILLAVGIVATSVVSALLVGLLVFFFALTLAGAACYVRCLTDGET